MGMDPNSDSALEVYGIMSKTCSFRTKMTKVTVDRQKYIEIISNMERTDGFDIMIDTENPIEESSLEELEFIEIEEEKREKERALDAKRKPSMKRV